MASQPEYGSVSLVSRDQLESLLSKTGDAEADPRAGLFGPRSVTWKINREAAVFLGAGRASLLQLAHPWVATALAQHSTTLSNPIGRFHKTFRVIYTMLFGTRVQAVTAARNLYELHTTIQGQIPERVAAYRAGSHYEANEVDALCWVFATLVESAVMAYDFAMPPLTGGEREIYYRESKKMAGLFGIPENALPRDWSAFLEYNRDMWTSNALGVNAMSRSMAHRLLVGAGSWIRPPVWYRALTAAWMPERFRAEFALNFGTAERRAVRRAVRWFPRIYKVLPKKIRWVGPYQEAQARLHGQQVGWLTQKSNQFWMGQRRLMFVDDTGEMKLLAG